MTLAELAALKPGWDSYAGKPPAARALRVVSVLLSQPQIVPCSDGGVQLEWHHNGVDIELGIGPAGEAESFWVGVEVATLHEAPADGSP